MTNKQQIARNESNATAIATRKAITGIHRRPTVPWNDIIPVGYDLFFYHTQPADRGQDFGSCANAQGGALQVLDHQPQPARG
jgi:hypothetical protein